MCHTNSLLCFNEVSPGVLANAQCQKSQILLIKAKQNNINISKQEICKQEHVTMNETKEHWNSLCQAMKWSTYVIRYVNS